MNLDLLESFHQNYPEAADGHLERIKKDENSREAGCATFAITLQFNRVGSLVAIGCNDGRIEIWDFVTRRIAKILVAHSHPICSLSWSRDSRLLLSASIDKTVSIWDIVTGDCKQTFTFPCPVLRVQFHPRNQNTVLVCPLRHAPVVIDVPTAKPHILESEDEGDLSIVASFDRRGKHIYTGNSKGKVIIYATETFTSVASFRSNTSVSNAAVKSIEFSRRGDYFLLNCADRIIRVYGCQEAIASKDGELNAIQKLKDLVTNSHWRKCCFSGDGEFVCAGSMKQHSIYLWERASGTLVKILHGQKGENLLDVIWHPLRPIVLSLSNSATKEQISIWAQPQVQNWSAFAPDFKELDENVEYEERESEFDADDEDKKVELSKEEEETDAFVDIETVEPVVALLSSDEETEPTDILMYLQTAPEIDNPEDHSCFDDTGAEGAPAQKKRASDANSPKNGKVNGSAKRPRLSDSTSAVPPPATSSYTIDLPNAPLDEVHPLVGVKKPSSKAAAGQLAGQAAAAGAAHLPSGGDDSSDAGTEFSGQRKTASRNARDRLKARK